MKTLVKFSLGLLLLCSAVAHAELKPYIGLNIQFHQMKFKTTEKKLNHASSPQGDFTLGVYLTDNIALEAGYNVLSWEFPHYQRFSSFYYEKIKDASHKLQGPHVQVVGILPITEHLSAIASIGFAYLKSSWEVDDLSKECKEKISKSRTILKTSAGFRYSITDYVALRGVIGAMDTKRFSLQSNNFNVKPQFNHFTSIGVELKF